jgi:hypothetical protein
LEGGVKKPLSKLERGWGEVKKAKAKVLYKKEAFLFREPLLEPVQIFYKLVFSPRGALSL